MEKQKHNRKTKYIILAVISCTIAIAQTSYAQKIISKPKESIQKQYYENASNYQMQKIPQFNQIIETKNIDQYKNFYVVYTKNKQIVAFDLIKNKKLFERNIVYKDFVLQKTKKEHRKLYYDKTNHLIGKENDATLTNNHNEKKRKINTKDNYNKNSDNIPIEKENNILSFGSESFQTLKYLLPKIKIEYLKVSKQPNKSIIIKLLNEDNTNYSSIHIEADLYNENREIIESIIAYPQNTNSILKPNNSLIIRSKTQSKNFYRIRIYIKCKNKYRSTHLGPYFFLKNKMKIKIKAIPYTKNFNRRKETGNFYP